jgi:hypothetical protein
VKRPIAVLATCLLLTACGNGPADDAAQAACRAYGDNPTTSAERSELRATASEQAQRAAEADDSYAPLPRDMADAWSRNDAMAAAHNSGQGVSGEDLDAYFAADKQVRADCADAGEDLGPLRP